MRCRNGKSRITIDTKHPYKLYCCCLIDLDFDGISEMCNYNFGSAGSGSRDGISYQNGKIVEFDMSSPGDDWVSYFFLLRDKLTGEKLWLAYKESQSGVRSQYRCIALMDFANMNKPVKKELFYCYSEYCEDDELQAEELHMDIRENGKESKAIINLKEEKPFKNEDDLAKETIENIMWEYDLLPHAEFEQWYGYEYVDFVSFVICNTKASENSKYQYKEQLQEILK